MRQKMKGYTVITSVCIKSNCTKNLNILFHFLCLPNGELLRRMFLLSSCILLNSIHMCSLNILPFLGILLTINEQDCEHYHSVHRTFRRAMEAYVRFRKAFPNQVAFSPNTTLHKL